VDRADPPAGALDLSVVIPVYRCVDCLDALHDRLSRTLEAMNVSFELVFVDDRSPDGSWLRLRAFADGDEHVRAVRLSRNFGQHAAITAGLAEARGMHVAVMDCDLQDPPEEIPRLYERAREGFEIVFARRKGRHHSWMRRASARIYFAVMRAFTGVHVQGEYGTFSLIERRVVDAYLRMRDRGRHYLFILYWLGFNATDIEVDNAPRAAGTSAYTFVQLVRHAFQGLFFQTTRLLRWIVYLGFAVALGGIGFAIYLVYFAVANHPLPGWTSLAVLILVIGGMIITSVGVTGLYIEQIFDQVKDRPLFVVDERVGG
jgi:polyisoprenyl-phosphate glycosyltransferase